MRTHRDRGDERRTVKELVTRYILEPNLKDIYVEGSTDAALISWFLERHERREWRVYPIETVNVPDALVGSHGLDVGARGRVLTLAIELAEQLRTTACQKPIMLVDQDFDVLLDRPRVACDLCLYTDFTSIELYTFNEKTLDKFLRLYVGTSKLHATDVINALSNPLVDLFAIRTVLYQSASGVGIIREVTRCCVAHKGSITVNAAELIARSVNSSSRSDRPPVGELVLAFEIFRSTSIVDIRLAIHGHDLIEVLSWFLHAHGISAPVSQADMVRRGLFASLEVTDLASCPMFAELLHRTE